MYVCFCAVKLFIYSPLNMIMFYTTFCLYCAALRIQVRKRNKKSENNHFWRVKEQTHSILSTYSLSILMFLFFDLFFSPTSEFNGKKSVVLCARLCSTHTEILINEQFIFDFGKQKYLIFSLSSHLSFRHFFLFVIHTE